MTPRSAVWLAALSACGARSPLRCPVDTRDSAVDVAVIAATDAGACSATLRVGSTDVPFGCVIDLRVGHVAQLAYPCAGGAASADFGDDAGSVFVGTVGADGSVSLALDTRFRPGDGCAWVSHQTITGSLETGSLGYTYSETPAPGEHGCLPPCPVSRAVLVAGDAGAATGSASATGSVECAM